jgi:hypothetical protein
LGHITSEKQRPLCIHRETTNHRKNRKNVWQLNTPDPLLLKSLCSSRLHYSAVSPISWHTQELGPTHPASQYMTCYLHPEMPRKLVPHVSRSHSSCCCTGNRTTSQQAQFPWNSGHRTELSEAGWEIGPWNSHCLQALFS